MYDLPRHAYIRLESDSGDRAAGLLRALTALVTADLRLTAISSIYETEAADRPGQPKSLSLVVAATARRLEPFSLLNFCLAAETRLGRQRMTECGERPVSIELLMLGDVIAEEFRDGIELVLPHPLLHLRRSMLTPLAEIAPHLKHPALGETMSHLLGAVRDQSKVLIYRP
jgi:2-amino-4-hydroxy-6-hydroxymethyldihydropteridine diphosphokinase